ncbi:hypothetical protein ACJBX5_01325 [Streptococcus suis]|nr:hypothetical protein [Streptococcus suis]
MYSAKIVYPQTVPRFLIFKLMKNEPFCYCTFRISRAQEKIATQGDCAFPVSRAQAKKTRQGLNSLS